MDVEPSGVSVVEEREGLRYLTRRRNTKTLVFNAFTYGLHCKSAQLTM